MITLAEKASNTFNRVMHDHSINLQATPLDFTPGDKCIFVGCNPSGKALAERLFDHLFPSAPSGTYYHYMTYDSFMATIQSGKIRLFSTKKKSSIGEYAPLCKELGFDGYWRESSNGSIEGVHPELMDELYYKSFVASPEVNAEQFWNQFADNGAGVRIEVKVDVQPGYPDFRIVAYEGSKGVAALKDVLKNFSQAGWNLTFAGTSRIPAYGQLSEFRWQNETRLIAKRHPNGHDLFPWTVYNSEGQECNFIDCSLREQECHHFQIRLIDVVAGPKADAERKEQVSRMFQRFMKGLRTNGDPENAVLRSSKAVKNPQLPIDPP